MLYQENLLKTTQQNDSLIIQMYYITLSQLTFDDHKAIVESTDLIITI